MPGRYLSKSLPRNDTTSLTASSLSGIEARIYNDLWKAIVSFKLLPGTKLDEAVIWDIYNVSRTVVRKVLIILQDEGIVTLPANRGAYVALPTQQDASEILEFIRIWIGQVITDLARAPESLSESKRQMLLDHLDQEDLATKNLDIETSYRLSFEFWVLLSFIHGNALITHAFERYVLRLFMALRTLTKYHSAHHYSHPNRALADLILTGNAQEALTQFRGQLDVIQKNLTKEPSQNEVDLRHILGSA